MTNRAVKNYTKRPLTDAEREFAGLPENHDLIFKYMKFKGLDAETFYDELIIDYLTAVKKYVTEKPELQIKYPFKQVLFQQLNGRMMHYRRECYNSSNTIEREAFRLDREYENHKQDGHSRVEPWWIDPMQNVEKYVIEKEFLRDIYSNIERYACPEILIFIVDMRGEGYSDYEIAKKVRTSVKEYAEWRINDIVQLIYSLTKYYNSALQRLYRDTVEYGNYEEYQKWETAHEVW